MLPLILMALSLGSSIMPVVNFNGTSFNFPDGTTREQMEQVFTSYMDTQPAAGYMAMLDDSYALRTDAPVKRRESYFGDEENAVLQSPIGLSEDQAKFAESIAQLETGGLANRSVRTKVRPTEAGKGSSAYGQYQITHGLLSGAIQNQTVEFSQQEAEAARELLERQAIALTVGGRDRSKYQKGGKNYGIAVQWAKAYDYESVDAFLDDFDYGGTLGLADDGDFQVLYESMARKLLNHTLESAGGDMVEAAALWHGGPQGAGKATEMYKRKMQKLLEKQNDNS